MSYEVVALVADTHGVLLPETEAVCQLADSLILHAGDVGGGAKKNSRRLTAQQLVAQLTTTSKRVLAVRGNVDVCAWTQDHLPESLSVTVLGKRVLVTHVGGFPPNESPALKSLISQEKPDIVVFGHSHQPRVEVVGSRFYINPGSAGPKRFKLPQCMALLVVTAEDASSASDISPPSPSHQAETSPYHAPDTQEVAVALIDLANPSARLMQVVGCLPKHLIESIVKTFEDQTWSGSGKHVSCVDDAQTQKRSKQQ